MPNFRIEAGLPPYGPPSVSFPNRDAFREGFVVSFRTSKGEWWTGNFSRGNGSLDAVRDELGPEIRIVISGGKAYRVDVDRLVAPVVAHDVDYIEYEPNQRLLVVGNGLWFEALGASGTSWRTRRISWDGMRSIQLRGDSITGEAYTPMGPPDWHPFEVNIVSGEVGGGSYNGPP